jgi:hypothetical protein
MKNKVGDIVVYTDEYRIDHNALVTDVHGETCVNLVYVTSDSSKHDPYGRQIERRSSCCRYSETFNFGNCFREVGVEAEFKEPARPSV